MRSLPRAWPVALLLALAPDARAQAAEADYARIGFYLTLGGVWMRPIGWDDDVQSGVGGRMGQRANANAEANAQAMFGGRVSSVDPVFVAVAGSELDEGSGGVGGVVGYRLGPRGALELEGEWIADLDSAFAIANTGDPGSVEVSDLWTLSANLKLFALTGRIQPFAVAGLGVQGSRVSARGQTTGLTTTAQLSNPPEMQPVSADFSYRQTDAALDGAIRVGLGVDAYATECIAAQVKADYVVPFVKNGPIHTDHLSLRVGLLYRF